MGDRAMQITMREKLDFGLSGNIPRYWFGDDPFKTRFFDAHSLLTPAGERFFITSLRAYYDEIGDQKLKEDVRRFIFQEGQHSLQHGQSNHRLQLQGFDVANIEAQTRQTIERRSHRMSRSFAVAVTAASEHLTTIVADAVMEHSEHFADADPRILALYAWHCAEELEHKSVCFDVMQQIAKVGYLKRIFALIVSTLVFQADMVRVVNFLLRQDGFSLRERAGLYWRGLIWMYGRKGFLRLQLKHYLSYFRPSFHPSRFGSMRGYEQWMEEFNRTNDPILASKALQKNERASA